MLPGGAGVALQGLLSGAAMVGWGEARRGPGTELDQAPRSPPLIPPKDLAFGGPGTSISLIGILLKWYPRVTLEQFQVVPV